MQRQLRALAFAACIAVPLAAASSGDDETILDAIRDNDSELIAREVYAGGAIDVAAGDGKTMLMAAAADGNTALVEHLLAKHADPGARNDRGGTALMYAAANGEVTTARRLLQAGAPPDDRAENGWTALTLAAAKGHASMVSLLLAAGADPDIPDVFGFTPLMRAAQNGRREAVSRLLVDPRTDIVKRNVGGDDALAVAVGTGDCAIVALIRAAIPTDHDRANPCPDP